MLTPKAVLWRGRTAGSHPVFLWWACPSPPFTKRFYDEILIDGPPRIAEVSRSILLAADLVVVPLLPSPLDVWAAAETVDLVREAQVYKEKLKCCLAIDRKIVRTAIGRDVRAALEELEIPVLKTDIASGCNSGSASTGQKTFSSWKIQSATPRNF